MNEFAIADWVKAATGVQPWWPAVESSPRWVRVKLGGAVIADSKRAKLLIQYGRPPMLPTYYFPMDDTDVGALVDPVHLEDGSTRWSVQSEGQRVEGGAWTHPRAEGPLADIANMVSFTWADQLEWLEEEEVLFAHARDPHKRVDVVSSSRHVRVSIDGVEVADSHTPLLLFETMLPTRFYLPERDVHTQMLEPSTTVTQCPYKGTATHWSVQVNGKLHRDLAWTYTHPVPENPRIRDLICFYNEHVDLIIDGEKARRPTTPWSADPPGTP